MKFLAVLSLIGAALALPTPTITTPQYPTYIPALYYSIHNVNTGAVNYGVSNFHVKRTLAGVEISSIATYQFSAATAGKTCQLYFTLPSADQITLTGSKQLDAFTLGGNPTKYTLGFPREFYRDQLIGRATAVAGATSYFQSFSQEFPCPAGQIKSFEAVAVGEAVEIAGPTVYGGLQMRYW